MIDYIILAVFSFDYKLFELEIRCPLGLIAFKGYDNIHISEAKDIIWTNEH